MATTTFKPPRPTRRTSRPDSDNGSAKGEPVRIRGRRKTTRSPQVDLRKDYRITLQLGLVVALSLAIAAVRAPMSSGIDGEAFRLAAQEVVQMEEIQQTEQIERPPPPPRPPVPVEVPNDEILDDVALDLDVSLDLDAEIVDLPPPPTPPVEESREEEELEIFVVVEQMPEIIGGAQKVYELLSYPEIARQAGVEGLAVIQVVVEPTGLPGEITVARSASEILDQAAIDAVSRLRFEPGRQRGKAVRVRMAIPIRFRLRASDSEPL